MKNYKLFIMLSLLLMTATFAKAQTTGESFYLGKWDILIKGTPNGDATVPMRFEMKEGKFKGYFVDIESKQEKELASATVDKDQIVVEFNISGYDVNIALTKKDEDNANGKLMDMFEVEAKRIK